MKKITKRMTALLLTAVLMLPSAALAAPVNDDGDTMIRVGLASSSNHNAIGQLACAHLQNADNRGAGYRFGYYDEDLNFIELAHTDSDVNQVAVMKTQNLCYGYDSEQGRYTYSANVDSKVKVGCFHIQLLTSYDSYEKAAEDSSAYGGFVAWVDGVLRVRIGAWFTKEEAQSALSNLGIGEIVGTSSAGISVVETGTDHILFQFDDRGENRLAIMPDVTGAEDVQTWFRGFKYRGGFTYERISGGNLTVVNVLPLEEYIKGVAPYEMGRDWPLEALKTQATCARTYAMINIGKHEDLGFDVCNSHWCQVYQGCGSDRVDYGPTPVSDQAVEESAGQVVWYKDKMAETYYSSSHGGASESVYDVWGSKLSKYPYLCGVIDPYEQAVDSLNANSSWTVTYSSSDLAKRLQGFGYGVGSKISKLDITYSEFGNVIKLVVHWTNGQKNTFKPEDIRSYFVLKSIRFTVNDVTVQGSEDIKQTIPESADSFVLNESDTVSFGTDYTDTICVITGSGEVAKIAEVPYVITGRGSKSKLLTEKETQSKPSDNKVDLSGTVTVSGSSYVFRGKGWGHQLGMSQYGAYAMAQQGFSFEEIIEFYFPGTNVAPYEE